MIMIKGHGSEFFMSENTIVAIATPIGEGSIGIIRLSGETALDIAAKIFVAKKEVKVQDIRSFSFRLGNIVNPISKVIIDEVLVSIMRGPKSYTGEDVVEINCHGGPQVIEKILQITLSLGAQLAEPGEFTKRAFLNGRLDLVQAEAVIDLIRAKTETAVNLAINQLDGRLSLRLQDIKHNLVEIMAQMEASIDFPEDVGDIDYPKTRDSLSNISNIISGMIYKGQQGRVLKDGLKTVIVGRPNVGKSSLLNALLEEDRAIVTDVPGTTRDIIEEIINLEGIPLKVVDTAGIRETDDKVEKIGVNIAKESLKKADLVLFMLDTTSTITDDDRLILDHLKKENTIVLLNKSDEDVKCISKDEVLALLPTYTIVEISAKEMWGLDELSRVIKEMVFGGAVKDHESDIVTRTRHLNALERTLHYVKDALSGVEQNIPVDLVVIDIRNALDSFGEITGETVTEDILDTIFSEFCIGK